MFAKVGVDVISKIRVNKAVQILFQFLVSEVLIFCFQNRPNRRSTRMTLQWKTSGAMYPQEVFTINILNIRTL